MKFPHPDRKLQTSCKNCAFAQYDGKTQVGCDADRISKFNDLVIEAYDNDREFYVINTFCNYYRGPSWDTDNGNGLIKIKKETSLSFELLFNCTDITENYKNNIIEWLNYLSNNYIDYSNKIVVKLYHQHASNEETRNRVIEIYKSQPKVYISTCFDEDAFLHETIMRSPYSSHMVISENNFPDKNVLSNLNDEVNENLKKFIVANNNGCNVILNIGYKFQYHNDVNPSYIHNINQLIDRSKEINLYLEI
jgi:hypothetical protein